MAKREAVGWLVNAQATSVRRACRVLGLSRATWRYQRRGRCDNRALAGLMPSRRDPAPKTSSMQMPQGINVSGLFPFQSCDRILVAASISAVPSAADRSFRPTSTST